MVEKPVNKSTLTTIGIDQSTHKLIDKLCKRYSLKKGEIVKLAFGYMDKACINPAETPESTKAELKKINKRQDDIIRFIRNYEEKELNPMIKATNSISVRFEIIVNKLSDLITKEIEHSRELQDNVLKKISEVLGKHVEVINNQGERVKNLSRIQRQDNKKLFDLIYFYSELAACGIIDTKKKENLKAQINKLIDPTSK